MVSSHGCSHEDCNVAMPGPNSPSPHVSSKNAVYCRKEENGNAETDMLDGGARIVFQSEESPIKLKVDDKISPDISQISGPDRESGFTPLSQLGFRDPASVGAGQQLTIMSVEVIVGEIMKVPPD